VLTGVLIGIGELVAHSAGIAHFDRHITSWMVAHRTPALDATMKVVTWLGSWVAVAVTVVIVLALVVVRRLPLLVLVLAAVAWAGEATLVNLVKSVVDRQRPPQALWLVTARGGSFPSGHAANAALVFTTLAVVSFLLIRHQTTRLVSCLVACLGVLVVGLSRVELGVHWTTDVIASVIAVAVWLAVLAGLFASHLPTPTRQVTPSRDGVERTKQS
jgi:membrane-associated phospholipid phosphatase